MFAIEFVAYCSHTELSMDAAMGILISCSHRDWTIEAAMGFLANSAAAQT